MSEKKSALKVIFWYLLILAAAAYLIYALFNTDGEGKIVCTGVDIQLEDSSDNTLVTVKDIEAILTENNISPKGQTYEAIDLWKIDSMISSSPYVDTARAVRLPSGEMQIRVKARNPILHIMADSGDEFYLDRTGEIIAPKYMGINLCIVTGSLNRKFASSKLLELGKFINDDEYWKLQVQQINVTKEGEIELVPRVGNALILLGEPTNIEDKLDRVRTFYEKGLTATGWNKYKTINASYANQIVCTKK